VGNEATDQGASDFDIRCSVACSHSAGALLAISVLCLAVLGSVSKAVSAGSVAEYLQRRLALRAALDSLEMAPCWPGISARNPEQMTIAMFAKMACVAEAPKLSGPSRGSPAPGGSDKGRKAAPKPVTAQLSHNPGRGTPPVHNSPPAAPQMMRMVQAFPASDEVRKAVEALVDPKLLASASEYSNQMMLSISNWETRRAQLMIELPPPAQPGQPPIPVFESNEAPQELTAAYVIEHLTLEEVRQLADYELPTGAAIDSIMKEQDKILLPGVAVAAGASFGAVALIGLLAVSMLHFWLYFREAGESPTFPAGATFFGVLWRRQTTYWLFVVAATIPLTCGTLLAVRALPLTRLPMVLSLIVALLTVVIMRLAWRHRSGAEGSPPSGEQNPGSEQGPDVL
jgi:hypothetical protein